MNRRPGVAARAAARGAGGPLAFGLNPGSGHSGSACQAVTPVLDEKSMRTVTFRVRHGGRSTLVGRSGLYPGGRRGRALGCGPGGTLPSGHAGARTLIFKLSLSMHL